MYIVLPGFEMSANYIHTPPKHAENNFYFQLISVSFTELFFQTHYTNRTKLWKSKRT